MATIDKLISVRMKPADMQLEDVQAFRCVQVTIEDPADRAVSLRDAAQDTPLLLKRSPPSATFHRVGHGQSKETCFRQSSERTKGEGRLGIARTSAFGDLRKHRVERDGVR